MIYVEAPQATPEEATLTTPWLFMAGGITGCPDWQAEMRAMLEIGGFPGTLLNPRRANFDVRDPAAGPAQIAWEARMLREADAISFWFPCETLCPITLYELGAWTASDKPIFVGTHPEYARRFDVIEQTRLRRPGVEVVDSLPALAAHILDAAYQPHHGLRG